MLQNKNVLGENCVSSAKKKNRLPLKKKNENERFMGSKKFYPNLEVKLGAVEIRLILLETPALDTIQLPPQVFGIITQVY